MKNLNKQRIMKLFVVVTAVICLLGTTGIGIAADFDSLPFPIEYIINPIIIDEPIPVDELGPEDPIPFEELLPILNQPIDEVSPEPAWEPEDEGFEEPKTGRADYGYVTINDYRVPLAGLINMNEGDCFD